MTGSWIGKGGRLGRCSSRSGWPVPQAARSVFSLIPTRFAAIIRAYAISDSPISPFTDETAHGAVFVREIFPSSVPDQGRVFLATSSRLVARPSGVFHLRAIHPSPDAFG